MDLCQIHKENVFDPCFLTSPLYIHSIRHRVIYMLDIN